jgi:hypothetical protein
MIEGVIPSAARSRRDCESAKAIVFLAFNANTRECNYSRMAGSRRCSA